MSIAFGSCFLFDVTLITIHSACNKMGEKWGMLMPGVDWFNPVYNCSLSLQSVLTFDWLMSYSKIPYNLNVIW
jgi:hypothetical protein